MSTIRANSIIDAAGGNTASINGITPVLATQAEAEAGTDNTKLMTPLRTDQAVLAQLNAAGSAPVYACRAWVNFNGVGAVAIRGSGNVSSITDNGVGDYTVNFATPMQDANYSVIATLGHDWLTTGSSLRGVSERENAGGRTASAIRLQTIHTNSGLPSTTLDVANVNVAIFR